MQRKTGVINFRGREIQVSTYYSPPFSFLKSTVNMTIRGVPAKVFVPQQSNSLLTPACELDNEKINIFSFFYRFIEREVDGIELNIFMLIAKALNFTYMIRSPNSRYK